ncbi:hypothetical protein [Aquimarina addita]
MKKSILNLGKALNKAEQKTINGGYQRCQSTRDCDPYFTCIMVFDQGGVCQNNDYPIQW